MEPLLELFDRDINTFIDEVNQMPEEMLWKTKKGVTNSCGILAQHVVGNLNHFIGAVLGDTGYIRDREKEFTATQLSSQQLVEQLSGCLAMLRQVLPTLHEDKLSHDYPLDIPWDYSTHTFLLHLHAHLTYHLGQCNYLRRILTVN